MRKTETGYLVTGSRGLTWEITNGKCQCEGFIYRGYCYHVKAAQMIENGILERDSSMTNCQFCKDKIVFDTGIKTESGKFIPLNQDKSHHDCRRQYKKDRTKPKQEEPTISNFTLHPELMQIHEEAKEMCRQTYGGAFNNATEDKKLMMVLHWENIIAELHSRKEKST